MMRTLLFFSVLASTTPALAETTVYVRPRPAFLVELVDSLRDEREAKRAELSELRTARSRRSVGAIDEQRLLQTSLLLPVDSAGAPVASR